MNYAVILNDVVTNIVVWDGVSDWSPAEGVAVAIPEETVVLIGFIYIDGIFTDPSN
jgi:hypothetical protein